MYSQAAWDGYLLCITILTFDFVINPSFLLKRITSFVSIREAINVHTLRPAMNRDQGYHLTPIYGKILQPHQKKAGNNSKRHWWWDPDAAQFSKHCSWGGLFLWNKKFTLFFFKVLCLNILHRDGKVCDIASTFTQYYSYVTTLYTVKVSNGHEILKFHSTPINFSP